MYLACATQPCGWHNSHFHAIPLIYCGGRIPTNIAGNLQHFILFQHRRQQTMIYEHGFVLWPFRNTHSHKHTHTHFWSWCSVDKTAHFRCLKRWYVSFSLIRVTQWIYSNLNPLGATLCTDAHQLFKLNNFAALKIYMSVRILKKFKNCLCIETMKFFSSHLCACY